MVFVRHALPGERVLARFTEAEDGARFWRADAVEVLRAAPGRVRPPCPWAGPGRCGGCDWQHAELSLQRELKAAVVAEQLTRLGGLDLVEAGLAPIVVEPVPGDDGGLGWRTRVRFAVDGRGRAGLRAHRSHEVVPVDRCLLAHRRVEELDVPGRPWRAVTGVEVVASVSTPDRLVVVEVPAGRPAPAVRDLPPLAGEASLLATQVRPRGPGGAAAAADPVRLRGRGWVAEEVAAAGPGDAAVTRSFRVSGSGFWQVHPGAAGALSAAVLEAAAPRPGERAWDLFSGVGLFSVGLAEAVGQTGAVVAVESDRRAVKDARRNLHDLPMVRVEEARVERWLADAGEAAGLPPDVVVLDPPRTGCGRAVLEAVCAGGPRVIVLVACDPAALGRDVAIAREAGYRLDAVRAFDLFPMTHHVETVATLRPTADRGLGAVTA